MDPISDMLIRIKNAQTAGHDTALMPYSQLKQEIAKTLERAGFIAGTDRKGKRVRKILEVTLRGGKDAPAIRGVKLLSTPGLRRYLPYRELRRAPHGGMYILTTPKGVMSGSEARKQKVGGELIAEIW
ncbi:MAG: 30S ribosomal protein S8 [Candidatus Sungbacteria bacterium RIFCSPLOWO2_02_FULL_54_10]|uniref:Small ribosomal subunit protein uS8 n=2 Tax=Candidatus Sungiibacteriota TaxID=1817917 RepID=A0A1G2L9F5_9BACT|nr:MAG: 30S ribosomal protein S8 [Candidatus Sungbacteria bacterium RIFCSPHIGHO2_01_FULL_54_26]OHA02795.1 MAG: 30S ribosomal protein S8 [Candidatus Sungbacteria bacterium RIFCSPHIGHO2_02_FULL_53_17]OHA08180.1 MAG: 30S ribosomal protein S8 [Candidatus Sungbacteria bacterium RIFCSPLOWO2_01_FULL_54_21]OHA12623.1 MAG: 30S ribosomal protein S8 [Candidatus Sungbacteria bacterium RIFCSPLOWO2_02_FULL_54_10]